MKNKYTAEDTEKVRAYERESMRMIMDNIAKLSEEHQEEKEWPNGVGFYENSK